MLFTARIEKIMTSDNFKINEDTYQALIATYEFLCDGRIFLAREILENLLDINTKDRA
jgi:hypothetical protein